MPTNTAGSAGSHSHDGSVRRIVKQIVYGDSGVAKTVGVIAATSANPALVLRAYAVVTTAFNAGTSNVLDIGTSADDDGFATDIALGTIGVIAADEFATTNDMYLTADTTITATPALSGTAASAGAAYVVVEYIHVN